jgi:hypothetical protein
MGTIILRKKGSGNKPGTVQFNQVAVQEAAHARVQKTR